MTGALVRSGRAIRLTPFLRLVWLGNDLSYSPRLSTCPRSCGHVTLRAENRDHGPDCQGGDQQRDCKGEKVNHSLSPASGPKGHSVSHWSWSFNLCTLKRMQHAIQVIRASVYETEGSFATDEMIHASAILNSKSTVYPITPLPYLSAKVRRGRRSNGNCLIGIHHQPPDHKQAR